MKKVYYHIEDGSLYSNSVGVICVENGVIPYDIIKEAIEEHLDENIILENDIEWIRYKSSFKVRYRRGQDDPFYDTVTAQRTTLYF